MSDFATAVLTELRVFTRPIERVAYSPDPLTDLRALLSDCGWFVTTDLDVDDITSTIDAVIEAVEILAADPIPDDLFEVIDRIDLVADVVAGVQDIGTAIAELGDGPPPTADDATAFAEDLFHHLAILWLSGKGDVLGLTDALGLTRWVDVDARNLAWTARLDGVARRVAPEALLALMRDPTGEISARLAPLGWNEPAHVGATLLAIASIIDPLLGGGGWRADPRRHEQGVDITERFERGVLQLPLPVVPGIDIDLGFEVEGFAKDVAMPSGGRNGPGVSIMPFGGGAASLQLGGWDLSLSGALDIGGPIELTPNVVDLGTGVFDLDIVLNRLLDLVIGVGRTGLTLGTIELSGGWTLGSGTDEFRVGIVARNSSIGISTHDFGGAIAKVLPLDLHLPFDLGIEWSSIHGLTLAGSASLEIELADEILIAGGLFAFRNLVLGFDIGDDAFTLGVVGDVHFDLNVLQATVGGVGIGFELGFPGSGGSAGPIDVGLSIDPPNSIGLAVDLEAVSGGGFLDIDHEIGRYSGALSLEVISVGITAITVIDTQLPGDPDGFAVFASLTITFPGIPLGFGFVLTGVGGIVAINRTIDPEALGSALLNGALDGLMFPDDPIGDAAALIAQIDDYFPLQQGSAVFGPVIELGWGAPTPLITAQVGVLIALPDGIITILGSISALLPTPAAPLITLNMDVLGVIDLPAAEISVVASLYDSRLLETISLSGDMAMFVRATGQPYFLLSVGGYHPSFQPPANIPASMHDLRRMTASIAIASNVEVSIRAYFALTSNTVQFGASINVEASVEIWPTTYSARGWFEFNILLQFSPFKLVADMSAGVAIYSGNKELMGVELSVQLEGPEPWYVVGNASFKFFGVKVKFELEVGSQAVGEPKESVPIREQVVEALKSASAWSEAGPVDGDAAGIVYGELDPATPDDTVWVRADHQLAVTQGIAPLERTIEVVGQGVPAAGHEELTVTGAAFGDSEVPYELVDDWFAPAQYESMGRTEKLTRASYEMMVAGVSFGTTEPKVDTDLATTAPTGYETETWAPDTDPLEMAIRTSGMGLADRFGSAPVTPMFTVAPTNYTVVSTADGTLAFPDGVGGVASGDTFEKGVSQSIARKAVSIVVGDDPTAAPAYAIVPATARLTVEPTEP